MKNYIPTLVVAFSLMAFVIFNGCETSPKEAGKVPDETAKANSTLEKANAEYLAEIDAYRMEKAQLIAANDSTLVLLKSKMANEKKDMKADYDKTVTELEQKNKDLKFKMANYKDGGKERWESFKQEFNYDMDKLGTALKDLTVNNKK